MTGSDRFERLREAMAARVDKGELPGMVFLVAEGDTVRAAELGTRDVGGTAPMRRDTVFRIASVTKPIVATVAMMLVEDGVLALDEPVDRLLPELADRRVLRRLDGPLDDTVPAARPVTVEDVLTFRLGHGMVFEPTFQPPYPVIRAADELGLVMAQPDPRTTLGPDEWIGRFGTLPLMYQPGERWQYNTGALILGVLVARAAGQPLGDVLADRLFRPLGMAGTGFWLPTGADELPRYYATNPETGRLEEQGFTGPDVWSTPPPFPSAASGLVSTADDLLAFARLLRAGGTHDGRRLLSEDSLRRMTTNHLTPEQIATGGPILAGSGWGYGTAVATTPDGRYGWDGGYGTSWFNDPSRDLAAIVLTQTTDFLFAGGLAEFKELV